MKRLKQFQQNLQSITQVLLLQATAEDVVCGRYQQVYHMRPLKYGEAAPQVMAGVVAKWDIHQRVEVMDKKRQK
jgi:hypothetical protein